jgi:hypothetical protein
MTHRGPHAYIDVYTKNRNPPSRPGEPLPFAHTTKPEEMGWLSMPAKVPFSVGHGADGTVLVVVAKVRAGCARGRFGVSGWAAVCYQARFHDVDVFVFRRRAQAEGWAAKILRPLHFMDEAPRTGTAPGWISFRARRHHSMQSMLKQTLETWAYEQEYNLRGGVVSILAEEEGVTP